MSANAEAEPTGPRVNDQEVRSLPAGLLVAWRRIMSGAASAMTRGAARVPSSARSWAHQWRLVRAYHADSASPWAPADDDTRRVAAAVGVRAFIVGLIVTGIGIAASTSLWLSIAVGVGSQVLWASARFIILALLMPRGTVDRTRLSTAYLAGLLPSVFAATWLLRLAALAVSAALTKRGLVGAGVPERDARIAIAWAFGGQVAIVAVGWAARALIVLVLG